MTVRDGRIMAMGVSTGKVGFVYLIDGDVRDWRLSVQASRSIDDVFAQALKWFEYYRLDLVLMEVISPATRKGRHSRMLSEAIAAAAAELDIPIERIIRRRRFDNKYAEASALAEQFPILAPWLPKPRRLWETEPREILYFEALALAVDEDAPVQLSLPLKDDPQADTDD